MVLMCSPEGEEYDIPDEGVAALTRLGWEVVKSEKKAPAKKAAAPKKSD